MQQHLNHELEGKRSKTKMKVKPYKHKKCAYQFFCQDKLNNELKDYKDPKEKFKKIS